MPLTFNEIMGNYEQKENCYLFNLQVYNFLWLSSSFFETKLQKFQDVCRFLDE